MFTQAYERTNQFFSHVQKMAEEQWNHRHEAIKKFGDNVQHIGELTYEAVVDGLVCGKETRVSKKVENWTRKALPPIAAKVAFEFMKALPFIATAMLLPWPAALAVSAICGIGRIATFVQRAHTDMSPEEAATVMNDMANGQAIASIATGSCDVVRGTLSRDPVSILMGTAFIIGGIYTTLQTRFLQHCVTAVQETLHGPRRAVA